MYMYAADNAARRTALRRSDPYDATSASGSRSPGLAAACRKAEELSSQPLQGMRFGLVTETMGEGVDEGVQDAIRCPHVDQPRLHILSS